MKWFFSALLIANLGVFIWLFPQRDGASMNSRRLPDVGLLQLVGEPVAAVKPPGEAPEEAPPLPEEEPAQTAPPIEAHVTPPPPVELASLAQPPEAAPAPHAATCGTVGDFAKRSQAELLSVRMLAEGAKTEIFSESSNDQAGFWVLIPPQENRRAAIAIAKRLEDAGITDIWRFTSGKLAHAISLGLFRDEERAEARRDKIAGMGFDTIVRPRYREQTRYWLDYRYTDETPLSDAQWRELNQEYPDLERQERPCPD